MGELRWLIFGAGAIGTYIGGSLALQGKHVVFLEQPSIAEKLRQHSMRLSLLDGDHQLLTPQVYGSITEALARGPFDITVFALKSYDTQAALEGLVPYANQLPAFLCLQNGVENEGILAGLLGKQRIIPGTVTSAIGRRAAGDIVLERLRGMGISAGHELSNRITTELNDSGLNAHMFSNPRSMKWSKLLTNLLANAVPAILNLKPIEVLAHSGLYRLEMLQIQEALRVMDAQNIPVVNLPKTPVKLLALAAQRLPLKLSQPLMQRVAGRGRGQKMPSLHIDLHSGRGKSEVDYLNGAVARFGKKLGVATPVNRGLNELLLAMIAENLPLNAYTGNPQKLINLFN